METEEREMNELAARERQTFGETLRERVSHKLHTIETVMETETGRIQGSFEGCASCCGATCARTW